jgi:hypothetical protein
MSAPTAATAVTTVTAVSAVTAVTAVTATTALTAVTSPAHCIHSPHPLHLLSHTHTRTPTHTHLHRAASCAEGVAQRRQDAPEAREIYQLPVPAEGCSIPGRAVRSSQAAGLPLHQVSGGVRCTMQYALCSIHYALYSMHYALCITCVTLSPANPSYPPSTTHTHT